MNSKYPAGMLTNLARAFIPKDNTAENLKTQAYVMSAAANRDRDAAAAGKYKAEAEGQTIRNKAMNPEAMADAVGAMYGFKPEDMAAWKAERMGTSAVQSQGAQTIPMDGPTSFTPTGNVTDIQALGRPGYDQARGLEEAIVSTPAAVQPQPAAPARDFKMQNAMLGNLIAQLGLTGNTNADQLQNAVGQFMKNQSIHAPAGGAPGDVALMQRLVQMGAAPDKALPAAQESMALGDVMRGKVLPEQAMALMKASPTYNTQGIGSYTGKGGAAFNTDQSNTVRMNDADNATSRRNTDVSQATERWKHTTPGANKGADKAVADESAAINEIDLTMPIVPQVAKSDPDYQQFYRIYTNARKAGDQRTLRALVHKALKHGLIRQGE